MTSQYSPGGSVAPRFGDIVRNSSATTTATITTRVEVLTMSPVTFWLATSILIWLAITIVIIASVQREYYAGIIRNVECIADVLILVTGSERLREVSRKQGMNNIIKKDQILTRISWFRDSDVVMRWRINLVGERNVQMQTIRLGSRYAPVSEDDREVSVDTVTDHILNTRYMQH